MKNKPTEYGTKPHRTVNYQIDLEKERKASERDQSKRVVEELLERNFILFGALKRSRKCLPSEVLLLEMGQYIPQFCLPTVGYYGIVCANSTEIVLLSEHREIVLKMASGCFYKFYICCCNDFFIVANAKTTDTIRYVKEDRQVHNSIQIKYKTTQNIINILDEILNQIPEEPVRESTNR
ncbi:hypothetical protein FQR65_LT07251 [Abscondita terminalis]|nr:hypothetical protein FQR65_LT07251 [Abscondita terminalis]